MPETPAHHLLVIGCGSIGERHLRCFQQTGRATVTACDTNPALLERMRTTYGVPVATDAGQALSGGAFTGAVICTPAPWHVPIGIKAMRGGAHVLIEKPLSHSLQDVDTLLRTRDETGKQAAVAYVYRVFPFLVAAQDFLRTSGLGPILQATATSGQAFHRLRPAYAQTYYRDRALGGGAIQDALTHLANWMESVVGPTDSLLCDCAHLAVPAVTVEDTVHVSARNGAALVNYTLNQFQAPNETTLQLNTALGSVKVEVHRQRWGVMGNTDPDWTWHDAPVEGRDSHFIAQANAFLDQVEGRPSRLCSLEAAAATLRFNLAALASAEKGARVSCHDLPAS
jgi:predicted dehydrogenase